MTDDEQFLSGLTRRAFLNRSAHAMGAAALGMLMGDRATAASAGAASTWPGALPSGHYPKRAKTVIHLCMAGGPSHLETFDYKPYLEANHGKPMPADITKGKPIAQLQGKPLTVFGPQHAFRQHGQSGTWVSDVLPNIAGIVDDIAVVRSLHTDQINHDPAHTLFNTGALLPGRPSMGAWVNYALGSVCEDLPGYVVMTSEGGGQSQPIASRQWSAGFLPSRHQGVVFNASGDPVHYVSSPKGVDPQRQLDVYDAVNKLDHGAHDRLNDPEIMARISQYEMAARMQLSVPELMDVANEPKSVLDMYGATPGDGSFASNCLMARRMAERGVRFIQLYHRGWDHHGGVKNGTAAAAGFTDQACAALVRDLKQRGMLDDVFIMWGGEFGRTPMSQGGSGRDHHIQGYSMWFAGGGIKGGQTYGATDELGYSAVENPVHVRDVHATMLDVLGLDHNRLTYKFQGLDAKLTGVEAASPVRALYA
jgi:hypothetical protein